MKKYDNDQRIISGMKHKEEKALRTCISKYKSYVAYIVGNIIGMALPKVDQEELIADVFISLWNHAHSIDEQKSSSLRAYIGAVARNKAKNKLREMHNERFNIGLDERIVITEADVSETILKRELGRILTECIKRLSPEDQKCFIKYYYYGKPVKMIAAELKLSESSVKSKLARGRSKLKTMIMEEVEGYADFDL